MIKAVVFDLDGVLVDSEPVWGLAPEPDRLQHGQVREQGGILEDQADAACSGSGW